MNDVELKLVLAVFSFLFGAILTRWWDRARPLVLLQGFANVTQADQPSECSQELEQLTRKSWNCDELRAGQVLLKELQSVDAAAGLYGDLYDDAIDRIPSWTSQLERATSDLDVQDVLSEILPHRGMSTG